MDINYKQCAINCVGGDTLKQYKKQFDECNQDFDLLFSRDTGDKDFYRRIPDVYAGRMMIAKINVSVQDKP